MASTDNPNENATAEGFVRSLNMEEVYVHASQSVQGAQTNLAQVSVSDEV